MNTRALLVTLALSFSLSTPGIGLSQSKDQLGTVNFANSCSPAVQETFQRGVAMLHSFRYGEAEKTFREVLAQDPSCAIATWGIAAILMSNPLTGFGPSKEWAERAQAAIDQGRKIGAKTQRERDYIEAVAVYYDDWANRPERVRQLPHRRRGPDLLRPLPRRNAVAVRSELHGLPDRRGYPGERVREISGSSRSRALPHP